jgi:hypothetical protein
MSEPSSGVPGEIADADVEEPTTGEELDTLELELDEEKIEAWDEVKGDYQVDPGGEPVPNSMDQGAPAEDDADDSDDSDAGDDDTT